ncbi:MAG: SPFH domain-containing protein [Actinomycetota bacterium]
MAVIALVLFMVATVFGVVAFVAWRYERVPADKVLVVYGTSGREPRLIVGGGGTLVLPVVEGRAWLDLAPLRVPIAGNRVRCADGEFVDVRGHIVTQISIDPSLTPRAAERLLNLDRDKIAQLVVEIGVGKIRETFAAVAVASEPGLDVVGVVGPELDNALATLGLEISSLSVEVVPRSDG